jgi:hypothetical protein
MEPAAISDELWFAEAEPVEPIVVEVAESNQPGDLAIVGTDLSRFLAERSAHYFVMYGCDGYQTEPSLNALGAPGELRNREPTDDLYDA